MKIPAVMLAMVFGAATMYGQALIGYAGATAASSSAAVGSAQALNPGANLGRKMAAAMGDAPAQPAAHSGMQCKRTQSQAAAKDSPQMASNADPSSSPNASSSATGKPAAHAACTRGKTASAAGAKGHACHCMHGKDGKMSGSGHAGMCSRHKMESEKKS